MLSAILDTLSAIADFFGQLFDFLVFIVSGLKTLITMVGNGLSFCISFIGLLPVVLVAPFVAIVTIKAIKMVRE